MSVLLPQRGGFAATWQRISILVVLWTAFALRLQALDMQDIWWDEARNIDVAQRPFLQVATAPELDIHPPVYFWLLHGWLGLGGIVPGEPPPTIAYTGRFLSLASGLASVALLLQLGRVSAGALGGLLAAAIGGLSPFWLAESQETRMYTVGFALVTAAALALLQGLEHERLATRLPSPARWRLIGWAGRHRHLIAFSVLSALALATHYNALFILVAWYLWWTTWSLLQPQRWRLLRAMFLTGLGSLLLVLPLAPIALRQIPDYANPNLIVPSAASYLAQNWQAYVGGYAFTPELLASQGSAWLSASLAICAAGLAVAAILVQRGRWSHLAARHLSFLLVWLIAGLGLYYLAVVERGAFNVRYSSFVTPALYALVGASLAALSTASPWLGVAGTAVLLVGLAPAIRADLYDARFAREDISGVTDWLRATVQPGDLVFVDQKYPFGFYYGRYAIPAEETPAGAEAAPARYLFVDINTVDQRLNQWAGDARRVFWVQWFESDTDPRRAVSFLLDKEGERNGEHWFQGYSIDWWTLTPPNQFELAPDLRPVDLRFGSAVQAVAASTQAAGSPGDKLPVVIRWQRVADGSVDRPLKARVALYDAGGRRLAQSDQRILNDRHLLPSEWSPTDTPLNVYLLDAPPDLAPGAYDLRLLVYDADTLEPLPLLDAAGNPAGIEATLATVQLR